MIDLHLAGQFTELWGLDTEINLHLAGQFTEFSGHDTESGPNVTVNQIYTWLGSLLSLGDMIQRVDQT